MSTTYLLLALAVWVIALPIAVRRFALGVRDGLVRRDIESPFRLADGSSRRLTGVAAISWGIVVIAQAALILAVLVGFPILLLRS